MRILHLYHLLISKHNVIKIHMKKLSNYKICNKSNKVHTKFIKSQVVVCGNTTNILLNLYTFFIEN